MRTWPTACSILANTTATLYLPAPDLSGVTEGVAVLGLEDGRAILAVGSGTYDLRSTAGAPSAPRGEVGA